MSKVLSLLLVSCVLAVGVTLAVAADYAFIGNHNSMVFHHISCRHVSKMQETSKVFFETAQAAKTAGYRPCKVCWPTI